MRDLEAKGAVFVEELDEVPDGRRRGARRARRVARRSAGRRPQRGDLKVIDATCPLVAKVHSEARRYAGQDYQIVLIGHADHEEVVGTLGEAPDRFHLVEDRGRRRAARARRRAARSPT